VLRTSSDQDGIEDRLPAIDGICQAVDYFRKDMVAYLPGAFS
jgi:hypothetical protein